MYYLPVTGSFAFFDHVIDGNFSGSKGYQKEIYRKVDQAHFAFFKRIGSVNKKACDDHRKDQKS